MKPCTVPEPTTPTRGVPQEGGRRFPGVCGWALAGVLLWGCARPQPEAGNQYADRYLLPLESPGTQFSQLPPAVQRTVRAETGSSAIARIDKGTSDGKTVYRIAFENAELFPPLYVSPNGSVLYPNLTVAVGAPRDVFNVASYGPVTRVSPDDLPPQVMEAIQRARPDAEIDVITRETSGDRTSYVVTFKGRRSAALTVNSDGKVIQPK